MMMMMMMMMGVLVSKLVRHTPPMHYRLMTA
jgi:hypothetical protein